MPRAPSVAEAFANSGHSKTSARVFSQMNKSKSEAKCSRSNYTARDSTTVIF